MNTKSFNLDTSHLAAIENDTREQKFRVSVLPAYAIDYANLFVNGLGHLVDNHSISINDQHVVIDIDKLGYAIDHKDSVNLTIWYHGVRDYKLMFPSVLKTEPLRAERLGLYYREAEKCFQEEAWLSFSLMSAAIFEHLLFHRLADGTQGFDALITKAECGGVITKEDAKTMHEIRNYRNVVHPEKLSKPYIERIHAMDAKSLIEKLILKF